MKRVWWLFVPLLLLLGGCMPFHGETARIVPFHTVRDQEQWIVSDERAYLVVTERNWSTYYSNLPRGSNFAAFIYVVASLELKPNPGYTVRVSQLEQVRDRITVKIELKEPDPRRVYPQIIVHPIAVAEVRKVDLEPRGMLNFVFVDQKGHELGTLTVDV